MTDEELNRLRIRNSEEYKTYMKALCRMASRWVPEIQIQYAQKAFEKYQDESIRKLVLAYGEEAEKLDEDRFRDFCSADRYFDDNFFEEYNVDPKTYLKDSCLIHASEYAQAVFFLFDIKLKGE